MIIFLMHFNKLHKYSYDERIYKILIKLISPPFYKVFLLFWFGECSYEIHNLI